MKRGEVTAFLSLVFVLVVSFVIAMLEAARIKSAGNLKRLKADTAIFSVFGEYQKELLEKFDIFAVDTSYGSGDFEEENIIGRLRYYGDGDMGYVITGIQYLTDENGAGLREGALTYMENAYGLDMIFGISSRSGKWKELELKGEKVQREGRTAGGGYEAALDAKETGAEEREEAENGTAGEGKAEAEEVKTGMSAALEATKRPCILSAALPKGFTLSGKHIDKAQQISGRSLRKGRGTFTVRTDLYTEKSRLLFHEFLLKKFRNALTSPSPGKSALDYEVEYLIAGKASDADNLEAAAKKILMIRLGANMIFLEKDPIRSGEAAAGALAACALLAIPAAEEAVRQLILFAWAYRESMNDLALIFSGKKISLVKKEWEWQITYPEIFLPQPAPRPCLREGDSGYEDFLRMILFLNNEKELTMRALDCIEQEMRFAQKATSFRADGAMIKLKVENTADIGRGHTYTFPTDFMFL